MSKRKYKEVIDYELSFQVAFTAGDSAVGYCTPDTNVFQGAFPLVSMSGKMEKGQWFAQSGLLCYMRHRRPVRRVLAGCYGQHHAGRIH